MTDRKEPGARSFADIMSRAKPRETQVSICVAGDLAAEADRLVAQLNAIDQPRPGMSLADLGDRAKLAAELEDVRALMREDEVSFRFRALPRKEFSDLIAAHPGGPDQNWDPVTMPPDLVARCAIEPKMTLDEVEQLFDVLNEDQRGQLYAAAWRANNAATAIPSSRAVSAAPSLSDAR